MIYIYPLQQKLPCCFNKALLKLNFSVGQTLFLIIHFIKFIIFYLLFVLHFINFYQNSLKLFWKSFIKHSVNFFEINTSKRYIGSLCVYARTHEHDAMRREHHGASILQVATIYRYILKRMTAKRSWTT